MSEVFLKLVNMSISASWLVLAVLLLRLVLKKAPKWISVLLWGLVAIRLICPFTPESTLSLIPSGETISPEIMLERTPEIDTGIGSLNSVINPVITEAFQPEELTSMNPLQLWIPLAAIGWLLGVAGMLLYTAVSYLLLRRKLRTAVWLRDNIYLSETVASPFVLGVIKPKIYLPFQMDEKNMTHVIAHEEAHIRRKDHWWKPIGFLLLSLHWFNPLMWLGYILLCRDIELACDEKVIRDMDGEAKADYTQALVACSINRRSIAACPLAFGEVGVKDRVKSVLHYKKPAFWIILGAIVVCVAVAVCFLTNPAISVDETLSVFIDCQIAEHFQTEETAGRASCVNWKVLGAERNGKETTVYMWVLYEEYSLKDGALYCETGSHIPTAITAKRVNGGWQLVEYWEPRDGGYYESDIKEKFPPHSWWGALDSQRYVKKQENENRKSAWDYFVSESQAGGVEGPVTVAIASSAVDENNNWVTKAESKLHAAISNAIMGRNPIDGKGLLRTEAHTILASQTVSDEPLPGETNRFQETTVFLYYMLLQFEIGDDYREQPDGTYGYAILTFDLSEAGEYTLTGYRDPRLSADYDATLMALFSDAADAAAKKEQANKQQLYTRLQLVAMDYMENREAGLTAQPGGMDYSAVIDSIVYDFDHDGKMEMCTLTYGPTSGLFSFCFCARPLDSDFDEVSYEGMYVLTDPGALFFQATKDHLQVRVEDDFFEPAKITCYDLMLLQGEVLLCEVNPDS